MWEWSGRGFFGFASEACVFGGVEVGGELAGCGFEFVFDHDVPVVRLEAWSYWSDGSVVSGR